MGESQAFSELELFVVASLVWVGAYLALDVSVLPGVLIFVVAFFVRNKVGVALGLVWIAASLSATANGDYEESVGSGLVDERAIVVSDARPLGPAGVVAEVKLVDGRRVEVVGYGSVSIDLRSATIGSSFQAQGQLRPIGDAPWLRTRHIVGRLSLTGISQVRPPPPWQRPPEILRGAVTAGAASLDEKSKTLYTGLVIGDDRYQTVDQEAEFRAAGMTHLLAVSGQNVAFVLAVLSPVLRQLRRRYRWLVVILALVVFAAATRFEPSVLRATISAGLATSLALVGLRASGIRILSLVVIALLFIDPFLARSVGFQLSVSASFGILVFAPLLNTPRGVPEFVWSPLSVTVGAQLAVSPVLLTVFGQLPLASIPANMAAGWAAGVVMMWGLTVGLLAGLLPPGVASVVQWPVSVLLSWIEVVADVASDAPIPVLGPTSALGILGLVVLWWGSGRHRWPKVGIVAVLLVGWVVMVQQPPASPHVGSGFMFFPGSNTTASVLVVESDSPNAAVYWLVENRVHSVDVVVFEDGGRRSNELADAIAGVAETRTMLAPSNHRIVKATRVIDEVDISTRSTYIRVVNRRTSLDVTVSPPM